MPEEEEEAALRRLVAAPELREATRRRRLRRRRSAAVERRGERERFGGSDRMIEKCTQSGALEVLLHGRRVISVQLQEYFHKGISSSKVP
jgi:hypothetical protein